MQFSTPEEKKEVFRLAKEGDEEASTFLMEAFSLRVWEEEELEALNLLLFNDVHGEVTEGFFSLLKISKERCERSDRWKRAREERRAGGGL